MSLCSMSFKNVFVCMVIILILMNGCFSQTGSRSAEGSSQIGASKDMVPCDLTFKKHRNRPYVQVMVNKKGPFLFLLDMGAEGIGRIDSLLVDELKLPLSGTVENFDGINSSAEHLVKVGTLEFGPINLKDQDLMTRNYNRGNRPFKIYGILGMDFFKDHLLTINYPEAIIHVSDQRLDAQQAGVLAYSEPFRIKLKVGNKEVEANLDTGSSLHFHFPKSLVEQLNLAYEATGNTIKGRRAYTTFEMVEVILDDNIILGGNVITNPKIYFSDRAELVNIGSGFLKDYILAFDQQNRRIRLTPFLYRR